MISGDVLSRSSYVDLQYRSQAEFRDKPSDEGDNKDTPLRAIQLSDVASSPPAVSSGSRLQTQPSSPRTQVNTVNARPTYIVPTETPTETTTYTTTSSAESSSDELQGVIPVETSEDVGFLHGRCYDSRHQREHYIYIGQIFGKKSC